MFTKSQRLVLTFGVWAILVLDFLALFHSVSLEHYLALCLAGLFIIAGLYGTYMTRPRWRSRIDAAMAIGALLFGTIVINKVLIILGIVRG